MCGCSEFSKSNKNSGFYIQDKIWLDIELFDDIFNSFKLSKAIRRF
jgi:hypothetical protein